MGHAPSDSPSLSGMQYTTNYLGPHVLESPPLAFPLQLFLCIHNALHNFIEGPTLTLRRVETASSLCSCPLAAATSPVPDQYLPTYIFSKRKNQNIKRDLKSIQYYTTCI